MQIANIFKNMAEKSASLVQILPEVLMFRGFILRTWPRNLLGWFKTCERCWCLGKSNTNQVRTGLLGQWRFLREKKRGKGHLFNGVYIAPSTKTWTNFASPLWTNCKEQINRGNLLFDTSQGPWWRNMNRRIVFGRVLHWGRELMPFWRQTVQIYYVRTYIATYILFTVLRVNRLE